MAWTLVSKTFTLADGREFDVDVNSDGSVELGITDHYAGPYNEGVSLAVRLDGLQVNELREFLS